MLSRPTHAAAAPFAANLVAFVLLGVATSHTIITPNSVNFEHMGVGFCRDASDDTAWHGIYKWACLDLNACKVKCEDSDCVGISHSDRPPPGASECARAGQPRCVYYFGSPVAQSGRHLGGPHALSYECYRRPK